MRTLIVGFPFQIFSSDFVKIENLAHHNLAKEFPYLKIVAKMMRF